MPTNEMGRRRREHPSPQSKGGDASMTELLPCPFCGGQKFNIVETDNPIQCSRFPKLYCYAVACMTKGCHGGIFTLGFGEFPSRAEAIAAWNRRTPPSSAGWQPISTAPKDGTEILVWHVGSKYMRSGRYVGYLMALPGIGYEVIVGATCYSLGNFSHWAALLPPPSQEGASEGEGEVRRPIIWPSEQITPDDPASYVPVEPSSSPDPIREEMARALERLLAADDAMTAFLLAADPKELGEDEWRRQHAERAQEKIVATHFARTALSLHRGK